MATLYRLVVGGGRRWGLGWGGEGGVLNMHELTWAFMSGHEMAVYVKVYTIQTDTNDSCGRAAVSASYHG